MTAPASSASTPTLSLGIFLAISPLAPGEDEAAYRGLRAAMFADLRPTGAIEIIWTRDVVDLSWELQRLERVRTLILTRGRRAVLERLLYEGLKYNAEAYKRMRALIARWVEGDPTALAHVDTLLARKGYDGTLLVTEAYQMCLGQLDALDCISNRAHLRRNRLLADIDRRRRDFAQRMRSVMARFTPPSSREAQQPARATSPPAGVETVRQNPAPRTTRPPAEPHAAAIPQDERLDRRPEPVTGDEAARTDPPPSLTPLRVPADEAATARGAEPDAPPVCSLARQVWADRSTRPPVPVREDS